ncbi:hypothetical protein SPB21_06195 [Leptothoe sp. ISB3NOV94-8A]|uniref:DUF998 domain-containing protein n=1 Tax=Adonisia turfae CCMR0081 TaxID=2292702 RepID=A0A6M0RMS2_9CYAN|nr:hypothetical protein [Adonisia turfae]NEZ57150.1 hypothetical protein [Adonisia turfae CCMR0081]
MRFTGSPEHLDTHILRSYSVLRWCMSVFGFILPLLLVIGGLRSWWWLAAPLPVQNSLSAYYHAGSSCTALEGVYRDLFVGILAAIAACCVIYSGFGKLENWLLNIAGICLAGVAFFPTDWPEPQVLASCKDTPGFVDYVPSELLGLPMSIHFIAAIAFFIAIMVVNIYTAMDTVKIIEDEKKRAFWKAIFSVARFLMPISIGLVLLLRLATGTSIIGDRLVLWIEWAGIWAFSLYWLLKSIEILGSKVDVDMVNGRVEWDTLSNGDQASRQLQRCKVSHDGP